MADAVALLRSDDPVEVAAERLVEALARAPESPRLAIPGCSASLALGSAREMLGTDWARLRVTWVDERCVPRADGQSNRGAAYREGLLDETSPPASELPLYLDGESPREAVARVESALDRDFDGALDVVMLGLGEDGHVASIFPGQASSAGRVAFVPASPKPPPERITLTRAFLATARETVLLATGEAKREALSRLLAGDPALPAHGLPRLTIVTDLALGETP